jgi:2-C-methyl-D-erythritol 4-phosphate cytidylyltransferase/2-C-methyl-D-erythritol 2,4-cyclodiphosphate synthase
VTTTALIVAAGSGSRMGGGIPKQFRTLAGKSVLRWAAEALMRHPAVQSTRVIVGKNQEELAAQALDGLDVGPLITGGFERADSVQAGLRAISGDAVLVHDAARPFCPGAVIDRLLASLEFFEGSAPVLPVGDTLSRASDTLGEGVDRSGLMRVQTPQAFALRI